jgi:hypothetical protein
MDESPDYPALAASLTSPAESISEVKEVIDLTNRNALFFLIPVDRPMASFASWLKRKCQIGFRLQNSPRGGRMAGSSGRTRDCIAPVSRISPEIKLARIKAPEEGHSQSSGGDQALPLTSLAQREHHREIRDRLGLDRLDPV